MSKLPSDQISSEKRVKSGSQKYRCNECKTVYTPEPKLNGYPAETRLLAIRPMIYLSFVFDHRILDGASANWFLMKVKETLENWS